MAYRGHFEHSLDAKNRLSIPARFRATFSSGVVLSKEADGCLAAWTPEAHETTVTQALSQLNRLKPEFRKLQRYYQGNAFDIELDASGRVTLPPPLLAHAGIEREVTVVGVGDHLELWAQQRWAGETESLDDDIEGVIEALGDPS